MTHKILIACEESQRVCEAFRRRGFEAYSCDIIECSGGHPEWHIMGDVLPILNGRCEFYTMDGVRHYIGRQWDLIVAHPPCTRLCLSGQRWLYWGTEEYRTQKKRDQEEAIEFFMMFVNADCERIVIENPVGIMSKLYRKPDCTYNPYDFEGETECKKTCLWLKGLPPLVPTRKTPLAENERTDGIWRAHFNGKALAWNDPETARMRSQTPCGVADAIAEQYGAVLRQEVIV